MMQYRCHDSTVDRKAVVTTGPTSRLPGLSAAVTPAATQQWQTGQLLQATVSGNSIGKVLLAIGNRQVSAQTSLPLEKGQQLTLQVRSLGEQPVLKIISALRESPLAGMVRLLLPRQGPSTPLLANLSQLARLPNPPTPLLLNELVRSTLRQMPDIQAVSTSQGLKKAIGDSGIFLESRLLKSAGTTASPPVIQSDFKANLLRLIQLVRNWPGSSTRTGADTLPPSTGTPTSTPVTLKPGANTQVPPAPASAGTPKAPGPQPPAMLPGSVPAAQPPTTPPGSVLAAQPPTTPPGSAPAAQPSAPDQIQRAARASLPGTTTGSTARPAATPLLPTTTAAPLPTSGTSESSPAVLLSGEPPAPLRGALPVPQSALQVSLDLINRMGNFRTDLLLQAEAALARIQLHQLAAVPREAERGLLEWLFELPIRRGDAIDLWSIRLLQDGGEQQHEAQQPVKHWTVQLAFDLPGLGPVQAQVQLCNEQVSTRFWAEQADTLPLLREHLHELREALHTAGLDVGELECQRGPRPAEKTSVEQPLIREKV
ncbi:MAG: flagellar hook-length control protein FliK [Gammaproteobacteria bacterium]|nr:MAG: flagellar hook-length control protein FliK [Gammaproteobacteria bacterium]